MSLRTLLPFGLALFLVVLAFIARRPFCTDELFLFDAADYIRAENNGFWAQYVGSDSVSVSSFLMKYRQDAEFRKHPWGLLYQQNDGGALRHFHVPGGFYIPALVESAGGNRAAQRTSVAATSAVTIAAVFLMLCLMLCGTFCGMLGGMSGESGMAITIAFLCSLFLCGCPVLVLAGTNFSPHALFTLAALLSMFALCRWLETRQTKWLIFFSIACGVSIGTLELSPILVVASVGTVLFWWWSASGESRSADVIALLKKTARGFLASVLVAAILWPGGVMRGGYLMSYGVFVFQAIFRSGLYFQQRSFPSSIYKLGQNSTLGASIVVLLGLVVWTALRDRKSIALIGFTFLSVLLFVQGLANGFRNTTYASHAVFCIVTAAALAIYTLVSRRAAADRWLGRSALGLIFVLTAGTAAGIFEIAPQSAQHDPQRIAGAIEEITKRYQPGTVFVVNEDSQAFIDGAPRFRFYGAASVTSSAPEAWVKPDRYYLLFDEEAGKPPADVDFCDTGKLKDYNFRVSCKQL